MSCEEGFSLDDIINLRTWRNVSTQVFVGRVKERNDRSSDFLDGVCTAFHYKEPLVYNNGIYSSVSVVSVMIDEAIAKTGVWAIPNGLHAGNERELEEFRRLYKPFELPTQHERTVELIGAIHRQMYKDRIEKEFREYDERESAFRVGSDDCPFNQEIGL